MRGLGLFGVGGGGGDERGFVLVEQIVELARDGLAGSLVSAGFKIFAADMKSSSAVGWLPDAPRKNLSSLPWRK